MNKAKQTRATTGKTKKQIFLFVFLLSILLPFSSFAQCWNYDFAYNTDETYTDLSSPTELIGNSVDDEISSLTSIGFTFTYNGLDYTQFKVSSNGFVNLGGAVTSTGSTNELENISVTVALAPLWDNLETNSGGSIGYLLTGSSPSRILKIEFYSMDFQGDVGEYMNFQVWLYEGSNKIEFRYGSLGTWTGQSASIGLNDETNNTFLSITPAATPTSNQDEANDGIANDDDLQSGLMYTFTKPTSWYWWRGGTSTAWATGSNWYNGSAVPTSSTTHYVTIQDGTYDPVITGTISCFDITVCKNAILTVNSGANFTIGQDLSATGGEFELNAGTVTIARHLNSWAAGIVDINGGTLNIGADWGYSETNANAKGIIELSGGTINVADDCRFSSSGVTGTMNGDFTLTVGDDFTNDENTWSTVSNGTVKLTADYDNTAAEVYSTSGQPLKVYNLDIDDGASTQTFNLARSGANTGIHIVNNFTITSGLVETKAATPANHLSSFTVGGTFSIGSTGAYFKNALETGDTYSVGTHNLHATSRYWYYGGNNAQTINYAPTYGVITFAGSKIDDIDRNTLKCGYFQVQEEGVIALGTGAVVNVLQVHIEQNAMLIVKDGSLTADYLYFNGNGTTSELEIVGGVVTIDEMQINAATNTLDVQQNGTLNCNYLYANVPYPYGAFGTLFFDGTVDINTYFSLDPNWSSLTINANADVYMAAPEIYIDGDDFTMNGGTLTFDGVAEQYIGKYNNPFTFTDVNITNTGGEVKVDGNVTTTGTIIVDPLASFTVGGNLNTSGGLLTVESTSAGTGSLIVEGTASGDVTVERFLTHDKWHYISAPVDDTRNFNVSGFLDLTPSGPGSNIDQFYWWDEDGVDNSSTGTWFDILNATSGVTYSGGSFIPAQGYAINYGVATTDQTISFSGAPYTVDKSITITRTAASTNEGANLVGNPFTSTIALNTNADGTNNFLTDNLTAMATGYKTVYLWNEQGDWSYPGNDYLPISNSSGATFAAPGQAFMVVAASGGATINFNKTTQKHGAATFYKDAKQDEVPRFYMNVENDEGLYNEILIAFIEDMTKGLDPSYDAGKLKGNPNIALYTKLVEDNGIDFAHQALPPLNDEVVRVKTGLDVSTAGNYTFKINELQNFDEAISIKLEDKLTGSLIDFRQDGEYSFFINTPGEIRERFVLHFNGVTGIEDDEHITKATIQTYGFNNTLYILNPEMKQGTVTIYNLTGQKVATFKLTGDTKQQQTLNAIDIINVVKIQTKDGVLSQKVIFR